MTILISGKTDFKIRNITRDKDRNYIMIKRSILPKEITTLNVYAPENRSSKYTSKKQIKRKGDIGPQLYLETSRVLPLNNGQNK